MADLEVIINAKSGVSDHSETLQQLEEVFRASNLDAHISLASTGEELERLAKQAAQSPAQIVVAGGGDGSINLVASTLVGSSKTLGVLPLGTLNHFAKDLKIPLDLAEAVGVIASGHTALIDIAEVNGRFFVNNSSLGLYPSIVRRREKQQRLGYGKWPAFAWAAISVWRRYPFLNVRLNVDGQEISSRTPFVFIGNNQYQMEGFKIGARERLDGGELCLYITHRTGRWGLIKLGVRALLGRLREAKDFEMMKTREVLIETHHRQLRVSTDGEVTMMNNPLQYRVRPGALKVIVPDDAKDS